MSIALNRENREPLVSYKEVEQRLGTKNIMSDFTNILVPAESGRYFFGPVHGLRARYCPELELVIRIRGKAQGNTILAASK